MFNSKKSVKCIGGGSVVEGTFSLGHNKGFTLAEVLITLAIIGVVAALTIPTLVANYQKKSLEAAFKKSYSLLLQSLVPVQNEFYGSIAGTSGGERDLDFYKSLWESYKVIEDAVAVSGVYGVAQRLGYSDGKNSLLRSYSKKVIPMPGCPQIPHLLLPDGSAVGGMYNCYANWIVFDINGKNGPNAIGHDIFYFGIDSNTRKLRPLGDGVYGYWNYADQKTYCSKDSDNEQNGIGCTNWALLNKCPDDAAKKYWECLP